MLSQKQKLFLNAYKTICGINDRKLVKDIGWEMIREDGQKEIAKYALLNC